MMLNKFVPDRVISHYRELTVEDLKNDNIELLLCDIDNTLVGPDEPDISEEALDYINKIIDSGIEVVFISNNTKERVEIFSKKLDIKTYPMALKPLPKMYNKIKKDFPHIKPEAMLSLGDQVMTDVLGSNFAGIEVVLTKRFVEKDLIYTKLNRFFENMMISFLKKRKRWPNEEV